MHHHLFRTHTFGKHGGHDIGLVIVGDGNKQINLIDMFFGQQFLIRRITKKDDRILQLFRQFGSALLITFDNLTL